MKRAVCFIVCVLLVAGTFTGCSESKSESDNEQQEDTTVSTEDKNKTDTDTNTGGTISTTKGKTETETETESGSKGAIETTFDTSPVTFTMFSADNNIWYEKMQSPVGKKITEITGVSLEIEYPVSEYKQKIGLMAASGDYPDFIFAKDAVGVLIQAGALIDLTQYINKYGNNIKEFYGEYINRLKYSKDDPSIYYFSSTAVKEQKLRPYNGFGLQHDVVIEGGYPELKTLDNYENAIKSYIDKHPTIDGNKTIGITMLADDWRFFLSVTNPAVFATGGPDDGEWYVDPETKKAVLHYTRPVEKEYFRWLNHMNDIGLLDKEAFIQKTDQYNAKIATGRVLGVIDNKLGYIQAEAALRKAGKEERMYGIYPLQLDNTTRHHELQTKGYSAGWGVSISESCIEPERAVMFINWLCSDEAQVLNNWGIEGIHYNTVDGKRIIPDEILKEKNSDPMYNKKSGIGVYLYPFPNYGAGAVDETGNPYVPMSKKLIVQNYTDVEKEVLSNYGAETWGDLYPPSTDFTPKDWGDAWQINIPQNTNTAVIWQKVQDVVKEKIPESILCRPSEFDTVWDSFLKDLEKANLDKLEQEFNKLLQERLEMWNF